MSGFVYSEKPIQIEGGEGPYLYDETGTEYLDAGANYAVTPLGHNHPAVTTAIQEQAEALTFVQCSYPNSTRKQTYEAIADAAPGHLDNVWLCNSGTEANEAAFKFARSVCEGTKIVSTIRAFHGRTMGSVATTWKKKYREPYEPVMGDVEFVPYGDEEELGQAVDEETAAVILEPIQGEGGINAAPEGYLEAARDVTTDEDAALIFDEVQTGMGRTGTMWACEQAGVVPDVLTTAKGLGNGVPVGATVVADWVADDIDSHGSTFSGGPVVSAAVTATLETMDEQSIPQHAAEMGDYLEAQIESRLDEAIKGVRGEGLILGIKVKRGANAILRELAMDHQILALPAGRTVVRLLPPLTIEEPEADMIVDALAEIMIDDDGEDET